MMPQINGHIIQRPHTKDMRQNNYIQDSTQKKYRFRNTEPTKQMRMKTKRTPHDDNIEIITV